ncbi:MAG: DUF2938 domain-containing protein [Alcanivorax nanhaiticus]
MQMHELTDFLLSALTMGITATLVMDVWGWLRPQAFGARPNYAMVGRWLLHMRHGQFRHQAIGASPAQKGERLVGWAAHYLTGICFAVLLLVVAGTSWIDNPTLGPALVTGITTVIAPYFLMQPGMGMGIAASKTPMPSRARTQSLITHGVFGMGLYLGGLLTAWL